MKIWKKYNTQRGRVIAVRSNSKLIGWTDHRPDLKSAICIDRFIMVLCGIPVPNFDRVFRLFVIDGEYYRIATGSGLAMGEDMLVKTTRSKHSALMRQYYSDPKWRRA